MQLASSAWAFASASWQLPGLEAQCLSKMRHFHARELTALAWSVARLQARGPLLAALRHTLPQPRLGFGHRELSGMAWALATLSEPMAHLAEASKA